MEFFLFAGLMAVDMLLFFYLASKYTYVEVEKTEKGGDDEKKVPDRFPSSIKLGSDNSEKSAMGTENKGFSDDTPM
jgi:hypothetical protein